ncbi:cyclic lactone autoinducer peptide [Agathobacter rectalis]|uniref:cyclic lactone autoinducer peptide n=1 Tax=Agathobacter rectalis TaxID=39491 RepID=UPI0001CD43F2|nr:cyclic lactone autoinducer peptide [Agathobacter rectalis]CBK91243.1 hypothetical protein EUR_22400 [Agathobacter rectalis DSM 17629]
MDNKRINVVSQSCANLALKTLSVIAKNNANSLCRGLLYEPNGAKKLKKQIKCLNNRR